MNRVILSGYLGRDAEKRMINADNNIAVLSLGVKRNHSAESDWHEIEYWNISDNLFPYLKKGMKLLIEGELKYDTYEHKGNNVKKAKITCNKLELMGTSKRVDNQQQDTSTKDNDFTDDDIPF